MLHDRKSGGPISNDFGLSSLAFDYESPPSAGIPGDKPSLLRSLLC